MRYLSVAIILVATGTALRGECDCDNWPVKPKSCAKECGATFLNRQSKATLQEKLGVSESTAREVMELRSIQPFKSTADKRLDDKSRDEIKAGFEKLQRPSKL